MDVIEGIQYATLYFSRILQSKVVHVHKSQQQTICVEYKGMQVEYTWLRTLVFRPPLLRHSYWCIAVPLLCSPEGQHFLRRLEQQHCHSHHFLHIYHILFRVLYSRSNRWVALVVGSGVIFRTPKHILVFRNQRVGGISNRTGALHRRIRRRVLDWYIRCGRRVLYKRYRIWDRHLFRSALRGNALHIRVCHI